MIRTAELRDIPRIGELLVQVAKVHHDGRPDLFRAGRKYDDRALAELLADETRPILVYTDENDRVCGYAFCVYQTHKNDILLTDITTLYIDDLCVDAALRGKHIGRALFDAVCEMARAAGCYNITLNVWSCNPAAMRFYEKCGLVPQKIGLETIL